MGLVIFAVVVAGVIYLIIKSLNNRSPRAFLPPPQIGYVPEPMMGSVVQVDNPLVDVAVIAAEEIGAQVLFDAFSNQGPPIDPGFNGSYDNGQNSPDYGSGDSFDPGPSGGDSDGGFDSDGGLDSGGGFDGF